ncbi:required for meiotic nuclear division protein 1 homolog [Amphiura filiformis]|uniref:required for meiotic nuclear division protein 1 homolog n=1 Tax=Amphiura filiformis TaxID=82378 RepID=UPI003B2271DF
MALPKIIQTYLTHFILYETKHTFQKCRTFASTSTSKSLFQGFYFQSGQIKSQQKSHERNHFHANGRHVPAITSQFSCRKSSEYCVFNASKKFQRHDGMSSELCIHSGNSKSIESMRLTNQHHLSSQIGISKPYSASYGDIIARHKHTDAGETNEGVEENKEFPLLFRHRPKKSRQYGKMLKSEGTKEKMKAPGVVDMEMKAVDLKKRIKKPAKRVAKKDMLMCSAYATAEFYYLATLKTTLLGYGKYLPVDLPQDADGVLYMHLVEPSKDLWHDEPTEIVFFEEGAVVFWNATPDLEKEILWILEYHQRNPYLESTVQEENEQINYRHSEKDTTVNSKGVITFDTRDPKKFPLEKFAISNAIMHSVKLAMWENSLDHFVDSIEYIPDYMSMGKPITMTTDEVMKKRGKLFALRHCVNLSSDLLIASDFYWDRDSLETLYQKMCHFYSIDRRTKVMNEKLNHCSELVELMRTTLTEKHSTRLEWMIIILIAVEVVFEFIHYIKLYFIGDKQSAQELKSKNSTSRT